MTAADENNRGVTWFEGPAGVTWRQVADVSAGVSPRRPLSMHRQPQQLLLGIVAALALVVTLVAGIDPAGAGKGGKGGNGGGGGSAAQACSDLTGSVTLGQINDAIGAGAHHGLNGKNRVTGRGVDVAIIDTGITDVGSLSGAVVDGPDLSFDALNPEIRHGDLYGHGTNMAGIVQAVAPDSGIIDVKVGAGDGTVDVTQVIAAIDWVVENRTANGMDIRVLNLAYGTDADVDYRSDPLTRAVENAWFNGIVVVVAGGNDGRGIHRLSNPALDPFVLAVGAVEPKNGEWSVPVFSSTGDGTRNPDLVAPGADVLSLAVPGSYLAEAHPEAVCQSGGDLYLRGSGTSQAAAVTSGAVAMLLDQRPGLTPNQVKKLLVDTAIELPSHNTTIQGNGMIDLAAALEATTPSVGASAQGFLPAAGGGSLDASRGSAVVGTDGDQLLGELTAFGTEFDGSSHSWLEALGATWSDQSWDGATWSGGTWSGATWSGATWSGATWSGATWSGATWSGATWSGATWSGATWSGATWSGATWSGVTWS